MLNEVKWHHLQSDVFHRLIHHLIISVPKCREGAGVSHSQQRWTCQQLSHRVKDEMMSAKTIIDPK